MILGHFPEAHTHTTEYQKPVEYLVARICPIEHRQPLVMSSKLMLHVTDAAAPWLLWA